MEPVTEIYPQKPRPLRPGDFLLNKRTGEVCLLSRTPFNVKDVRIGLIRCRGGWSPSETIAVATPKFADSPIDLTDSEARALLNNVPADWERIPWKDVTRELLKSIEL
jgi:hypothetical protein